MALTVFYYACAAALLLLGAGVGYATWQLGQTLLHVRRVVVPRAEKTLAEAEQTLLHVRSALLPEVELTLGELRRNLDKIGQLTAEVDETIGNANQLTSKANATAQSLADGAQSLKQSVGSGYQSFTKKVASPLMVRGRSLFEGVKAGIGWLRAKRDDAGVQVAQDGVIAAPPLLAQQGRLEERKPSSNGRPVSP